MPAVRLAGGGGTTPPKPKPKPKPKPVAPAPPPVRRRARAVVAGQRATNEAAAREGLNAAYHRAQQQQLVRQAALRRAELARRAALAQRKQRAILTAAGGRVGRGRPAPIDARRAVERERAEARHQAYEWLQDQARQKLASSRYGTYYREQYQQAADREQERADQLQSRSQQLLTRGRGLHMMRVDTDSGPTLMNDADRHRKRALRKGVEGGDWDDALDILDRQSRQTGGRYVDQQLYEAVQDGYVKDVVKVGRDFEKKLKRAQKLLDADNANGLRRLIEDPQFIELEEQFRHYFGDGRQPGSFAKDAKVLTDIAMRRERLWVASLLDPFGTKGAYQTEQLVQDAYEQAEGMTFREKVLDPATGEYVIVKRTGIDAYLAKQAARQQDQAEQQQLDQMRRLKLIQLKGQGTGHHLYGRYEDGRLVTVDVDQRETVNEAVELLSGGQARFDAIVGASPAEREQLVRDFMRDAGSAYDAKYGHSGGQPQRLRGVYASAAGDRTQWLSRLKEALTGDSSGYGFGDMLDQSYGLGDVLRGSQVPVSSMIAWLREQRARGLWGLAKPDYNRPSVNLNPFERGSLGIGTESDPNGRQAYLDYQRALKSDDPNVRANATRAYGTGYVGGNLGWLVEGAADPLNIVAPVAWLNRARLAVAAAGGFARLKTAGGLGEALAAYARYSSPAFLGGLGRGKLRTDLAKIALAKEHGLGAVEALGMADDEIRQLADLAVKGREALAASGAFERLFERSNIDREQLLNIIQQKLPDIADRYGLHAVDPFQMQARIRAAREGFARAEQQAEEAAQLERRRLAQREARDALERARLAAGRNVGQRVAVTPANLARHEAHLQSYVGAARDYQVVARRAARAADEIDTMVSSGEVSRGRLLGLHAQLQRATGEMRKYEDQYRIFDGERKLTREGLVAKRYRELAEFRKSIGGDPSAPGYPRMGWALVRQDRKMITARIRNLQRAMARAKPADLPALRSALTEAHKARVGIEFEAALLDRGRTIANVYGRRHMDRVGQAVRPQRLAQKATTEAERAVETGRDLSNRLGSVSEVVDAPVQTPAQAKQLADARSLMQDFSAADLVAHVQSLMARKAGVRFGGEAASDVLAQLQDLADRLGVPLADLSLEDLAVALYRVQRLSGADREAWEGLWALVSGVAGRELRHARFVGKLSDFFDQLGWEHVRSGGGFGLRRFEELDQQVADALAALRGRRAEGVVRGGTKRYGDPHIRQLLRPDADPAEVLTKMRTLRGEGLDLFEYDRARGVLRDIMLKRNVSVSLLDEAKAQGGDLDEAFLRVREQRAASESLREFEEFASRAENQGRAPEQILRLFEERYVGHDLGTVPPLQVTSFQDRVLREAWREQAGFDYADGEARSAFLQSTGTVPPLGDRSRMRDWLVDNGYWSPRTGKQIAAGERVWSVDEERAFFEKNWGFTPPWADRQALAPLMDDQRALRAAFEEWGFFGDGFEDLMSGTDLKPEQVLDAITWGREGFAGKRTLDEMRQWAVQRYGDLVGEIDQESGAITLRRMPWLMKVEGEYPSWMGDALSDAGLRARANEWRAARPRLPERIGEAFDAGYGIEPDRALLNPEHIDKLGQAITRATDRRLKRLVEAGDVDPGEWLPQEQLRFAYDVANELLADPAWRGFLRGTPVAGAILNTWSQFWRLLVSFQPAFAIMNLIETFSVRRVMLAVLENGFKPLSFDAEGRRLIADLTEAGLDSSSLFYLAEQAPGAAYLRVGDKMLPANLRLRSAGRAVVEFPLQVSKVGEDRLRLDFARAVAGRTYRAALKTGMEEEAAAALARAEAKRVVSAFFVTGHGPAWLRALNQMVPFFTYNYELKRLAVKMIWQHPAIMLWADRMARAVKDANRAAWAEQFGDAPFPEDDPSSSWLWLPDGQGGFYTVDLSAFSDWTRALSDVTQQQSIGDWVSEFFRIPHPSQLAALAALTGGITPWGKPGDLRELSAWVDLLQWMQGNDYGELRWQRDWIQMTSQMLFFKKFGHVTPLKAKMQQYFWFRQLDPVHARDYLAANPDLQAYFDQMAGSGRQPVGWEKSVHWYSLLSDDERADYNASYAEWKALNEALDQSILQYANQPWSEEYRQARKDAAVARAYFLDQHPILPDSWGAFMSPEEFASLEEGWIVDDLQDAWFNWQRPAQADYKSEIAYQAALVDWYGQRRAFLDAHPALAKRLLEGRNAVENAWREQELQWSDILEFQAKLKLRILEEQEKPDGEQDQGFIDVLYGWRDAASLELDAESYEQVYGVALPGNQNGALNLLRRASGDMVRRVAELPGFSDFIYGRATPEERADIRRNEWYAKSIAEVVSTSTDGRTFYEQLFRNPALLQEYWRRNPDARARYKAGQAYFRQISSWVSYLKRDDFDGAQRAWDQMPAWVHERYLSAHPDSGMADGTGGGGGSTAVQFNGQWFKSPESRDRYRYYVLGDHSVPKPPSAGGGGSQAVSFNGNFFTSPESRAAFIRGQEYFASISRWVKLLQAKDYVAADHYFRQMPAWMREKYYAKHPDQRAQHELDSRALRMGAEYFLARGDDKLAILRKYPELREFLRRFSGDEGSMRGLVTAMYAAIPSSDAWLKRLFRERFPEVFGQESLGEHKLQDVVGSLAEHPEMLPFYEKALKLQTSLFLKQLQLSKSPPRPLTLERKQRAKKRRKRRIARLHSNWTLHRDLRRHRGE